MRGEMRERREDRKEKTEERVRGEIIERATHRNLSNS